MKLHCDRYSLSFNRTLLPLVTLKQRINCRTNLVKKICSPINFFKWNLKQEKYGFKSRLIKMISARKTKNRIFLLKNKQKNNQKPKKTQLFKAISSLYVAVTLCKKSEKLYPSIFHKTLKNLFRVYFGPTVAEKPKNKIFSKKSV